jgi:hypothetical protein
MINRVAYKILAEEHENFRSVRTRVRQRWRELI